MTYPTSYATLQTAIAERRERVGVSDYEALTPDFIRIAENKLNRIAPVRLSRVNDATLTATPASRNITLPSDFLEAYALFLTTDGDETELARIQPGVMELHTTSGPPRQWAINAGNIELDQLADSAHTFRFFYRKKLFDLSAGGASDPNWLLTNYPDVYLYGSLVEAADYEMDDNALVKYQARFDRALDDVVWLESQSVRAPLRVDVALLGRRWPFNYTTGD